MSSFLHPVGKLALDGERGDANCLSWSRDGSVLAAAFDDGTLQFWSSDGSSLGEYNSAHEGCAWSCAWGGGDGSFLASTGEDGFARLWRAPHDDSVADSDSGQCITHHDELCTSCAWTFDGTQLISISDSSVTCSRRAPAAAPTGTHSASAADDDDDVLDGDMWLDATVVLPPGCGDAQCVAAARRTPVAAVGTSNGFVCCVALGESGQVLSSSHVQVSIEGINCLEFCAGNDALLYVGCNDGCIRLLDLNRMSVITSSTATPSPGADEPPVIHALTSVPSGVLAGDGEGVVKFWGAGEGGLGLRAAQQLHRDAVGDVKVSASGCVASCSMDGSGVHLWRLAV